MVSIEGNPRSGKSRSATMENPASRLSRRQFVVGAGVTGGGLLAGCGRLPWQAAPPPTRMYRLGFLGVGPQPTQFLLGNLRDLGYVEGQNVAAEFRDTGDSTDAAEFAAELVALQVDIIVTFGLTALRSASAATSTIPIVNASGGGDLVQLGLADSLAHPGRNVTGVTFFADRLHAKGLQLLTEVA